MFLCSHVWCVGSLGTGNSWKSWYYHFPPRSSERLMRLLKVTHLVNGSVWLRAQVFLTFGPPLAPHCWFQRVSLAWYQNWERFMVLGQWVPNEHLAKCWDWVSSMKRDEYTLWPPRGETHHGAHRAQMILIDPNGPDKLIKQLTFKWSQVDRRRSEKDKGLRNEIVFKACKPCQSCCWEKGPGEWEKIKKGPAKSSNTHGKWLLLQRSCVWLFIWSRRMRGIRSFRQIHIR